MNTNAPEGGDLYSRFESIGNNCEFGIVQRRAGFDPPGLFRNVGFNKIEQIIKAIYLNLEGMFEPGEFDFDIPPGWPDWRLDCKIFGFGFHSTIPSALERGSTDWTAAVDRIIKLFRYMKASFQDDLKNGEKIFVFRSKQEISNEMAAHLRSSIRMHGNGTLLLIRENPSLPSGHLEFPGNGIIFGYVHRLSNENPPEIDFEAWETMAKTIVTSQEKLLLDRSDISDTETRLTSIAQALPGLNFESILTHAFDVQSPVSRTLLVLEYEGLESGQLITVSGWIYLPEKYDAGGFSLVFIGYKTEKHIQPDISKFLRWQRILITARLPEGQTRAVFRFSADGIPSGTLYSAGWSMRLQKAPIT